MSRKSFHVSSERTYLSVHRIGTHVLNYTVNILKSGLTGDFCYTKLRFMFTRKIEKLKVFL